MRNNFQYYFEGEHELEKESFKKHKDDLGVCIELWDFLTNNLIKSIGHNSTLLMSFKHQVDIAFFLAITSTIRYHLAQFHQNIKYAIENMSICFYILNDPEGANEIYLSTGMFKTGQKLKVKGYELMKEKNSKLNEAMKKQKDMANNKYGGHANLAVSGFNCELKMEEVKFNTNIFDIFSPYIMRSHLFIIGDMIIGFINILISEKKYNDMLPLKDDAKSRFEILKQKFYTIQKAKKEQEAKWQNIKKPDDDCWCGNELKFKECHGRSSHKTNK